MQTSMHDHIPSLWRALKPVGEFLLALSGQDEMGEETWRLTFCGILGTP